MSLAGREALVVSEPQPVIQSVVLAKGAAVITWTAVPGNTYRLQFKDDLAGSDWNDALPDVIATGPVATATNPIGDSPQRFYRILVVP